MGWTGVDHHRKDLIAILDASAEESSAASEVDYIVESVVPRETWSAGGREVHE